MHKNMHHPKSKNPAGRLLKSKEEREQIES